MIEDKLEHDERIRLECLAQSIAHHASRMSTTATGVVRTAQEFEQYVGLTVRSAASGLSFQKEEGS